MLNRNKMKKYRGNCFVFLFLVLGVQCDDDLPCEYENSIDISSGTKNLNESITYKGKVYKFGLYSMIDWKIENGKNITVNPYARACVYNDALPCDYYESTNISGGKKQLNGSVIFGHMEFPKEWYANVSYKYATKTANVTKNGRTIEVTRLIRNKVDQYLRGCVCNRFPCIRFCSNPKNSMEILIPTMNSKDKSAPLMDFHYVSFAPFQRSTYANIFAYDMVNIAFGCCNFKN